MAPISSYFYMAYVRFAHAIVGGYFGLCPVILPDFDNVEFGKSGAAIALSIGESAMNSLVCLIACTSIPAKIGKTIVGFISIVMTSLHPFGTRTHKGQKDEAMDPECSHISVFAEMDIHVRLACIKRIKNSFFSSVSSGINSIERLCSAKVADLVDALVPGNIFPDFFHMWGILA